MASSPSFKVPRTVAAESGRDGSLLLWPKTVGGGAAELKLWLCLQSEGPLRQLFVQGECKSGNEGVPSCCFFAFSEPVLHSERFWIEEAEAPRRARINRKGLRHARDKSRWRVVVDERQHRQEGNDGGCSFYAYAVAMEGTRPLAIEWTSGDRYRISSDLAVGWGWTRVFSFHAFPANKYHVLEMKNPLAYKVVQGFTLPQAELVGGWCCLFAFYAFDSEVPGSCQLVVQHQKEPYPRIRVGVEPNPSWEDLYRFFVFDMPVSGSAPLDVHYTLRSVDRLDPYPEQYRISIGDATNPWAIKMRFYAFPSRELLMSD